MSPGKAVRGVAEFVSQLPERGVLRTVRTPYASLVYLLEHVYPHERFWQARFVARLLGKPIEATLETAQRAVEGVQQLEEELASRGDRVYRGEIRMGRLLHLACRILKPDAVVETGVGSGLSTAYLLQGLEDNGRGRLLSVDLPDYETVLAAEGRYSQPVALIPEGESPGWLVPDRVKHRWRLHLGRTQDILEDVLREAQEIDLFLHDSEHTYECMMFEYATAWESLREGGLLLSDDVNWNHAFFRFAASVRRRPEVISGHFGGLAR